MKNPSMPGKDGGWGCVQIVCIHSILGLSGSCQQFCSAGGQLGRMLASAASLLNTRVVILDQGENSMAKQVLAPSESNLAHLYGSFSDPEKIREPTKKSGRAYGRDRARRCSHTGTSSFGKQRKEARRSSKINIAERSISCPIHCQLRN